VASLARRTHRAARMEAAASVAAGGDRARASSARVVVRTRALRLHFKITISTDRANSDLSIRFANFNREFTI
jgi:hypothetical protein